MRRLSLTPLRAAVAICALAAPLVAAGCGKKGPPLAPFARAPVAPPEFTARRQGDQVVVRFVIPQSDVDGQQPAHIDRVEVYALSAESAAIPIIEEYADLVGTVPVQPPPPPPPEVEPGEPLPPPPPPPGEPALEQGARAMVVDELTPEELTLRIIPEIEEAKERDREAFERRLRDVKPPKLTPPDLGPPIPPPPSRFYVAIGRNGRRRGAWSARVPVPLTPPPDPPSAPVITVEEGRLAFEWAPPARMRRPVLLSSMPPPPAAVPPPPPGSPELPETPPLEETPPPDAPPLEEAPPAPAPPTDSEAPPPPTPDALSEGMTTGGEVAPDPASQAPEQVPAVPQEMPAPGTTPAQPPATPGLLPARLLTAWPTTVTGFVVDEVAPPGYKPPELLPGQVPPYPIRLTPAPVPGPTWTLQFARYGVERCFVVRTVETTGTTVVESVPSPVTCVTPVDTFPPAPPTELAAVASEGAISLIWEPSPAADLAGYRVLRAEAGGELQPLTGEVIKDTTYRDETVQPGVRYIYAVIAVDTAKPPNTSVPSNRVEETAR